MPPGTAWEMRAGPYTGGGASPQGLRGSSSASSGRRSPAYRFPLPLTRGWKETLFPFTSRVFAAGVRRTSASLTAY